MRKIVRTSPISGWASVLLAAALGLAGTAGAQSDPLKNYDRDVGQSLGDVSRSAAPAYPVGQDEAMAGLRSGAAASSECKHTFLDRRYNLC